MGYDPVIVSLRRLLLGTPLEHFLEIDPRGLQLPSWLATVRGIKPAMDLWVRRDAVPAFQALATRAGLVHHLDCYFDRYCEESLSRVPSEWFTTTRAVMARQPSSAAEAHVFVARSQALLRDAVSAGWYPLLVDGQLIDKHLPDHVFFGRALGYPSCCLAFYQLRNNWDSDNHYYAAYRATPGAHCWSANALPRHTSFFLAPHIPCSFSCEATVSYSAALLSLVEDEAPAYACEIKRRLTKPMLCLSELRLYAFEGSLRANHLSYSAVEPLNPTSQEDDLYRMLRDGDECIIEANIVKILRGGRLTADYFARADKYGPEFPFFVQCR